MSNNLLRHELQHYEDASVDIEDVLHNTHNLIRLAKPFVCTFQWLNKIRRWESWPLCLVLLIVSNTACFLFEGYCMLFSVTVLMSLAGLGYTHRTTNILAKFIPLSNCDGEPNRLNSDTLINSDQEKYIAQSEIMDELRLLLCFVNDITSYLAWFLSQLYTLLKWQDLCASLKCYMILLAFIIVVHNLSTQYLLTVLLDIFLLHFPINQYFQFVRDMQGASFIRQPKQIPGGVEQYNQDEMIELPMYDILDDDKAQETDENKMTDAENIDVDQKSEDGSSSDEAGLVEFRAQTSSTQNSSDVNSTGKVKKPGVVGKFLKTVKNQGPLGSCEGCKVNFTSILKRRRLCSHCGNPFCSRCCNYKVTRSMFGATAPAAQTETVSVCFYCFNYLNKTIHRKLNGDTRAVTGDTSGDGPLTTRDRNP